MLLLPLIQSKNKSFFANNIEFIHNLYIGNTKFSVGFAKTSYEHEIGLMNIKIMPNDKGMLFIFNDAQIQSFWMKNTYIPLDIIFIDENFEIINIAKNTIPLDSSILYTSEKVAKYVLEINGNLSDSLGISKGMKISIQDK